MEEAAGGSGLYQKAFIHVLSFNADENHGLVGHIVPILEMRKLRIIGVKNQSKVTRWPMRQNNTSPSDFKSISSFLSVILLLPVSQEIFFFLIGGEKHNQ